MLDLNLPCYAVIFSSIRTEGDNNYAETASIMNQKARQYEGYLGIESARDASGFGITISYWRSEEDFKKWKRDEEHLIAQEKGKTLWYQDYRVRIARVERQYARPQSAS